MNNVQTTKFTKTLESMFKHEVRDKYRNEQKDFLFRFKKDFHLERMMSTMLVPKVIR